MLLKSEKKTAPTQLLMFCKDAQFEGTNKDTFKGKTHQYLFTVFSIIDRCWRIELFYGVVLQFTPTYSEPVVSR